VYIYAIRVGGEWFPYLSGPYERLQSQFLWVQGVGLQDFEADAVCLGSFFNGDCEIFERTVI